MSKKANPTTIGLFIILGLVLGLAGLVLFSSPHWFSRSHEFILYFDNTLNGLNEGAPVKYRGVTVGSVKRLMIHFNQATNDYAMPVLIEIRDDLVRKKMENAADPFNNATFETWVQQGMRASLQAESLVTGVLYIEVRPESHAPPPQYHQLKHVYPELPTEATDIQQLLSNLASLDVKGTMEKVDQLITKLDTTLSGLKMEEISRDMTNVLESVNAVVRLPQITNSLTELAASLYQYRTLGERLNQRVDPVADSLTNTLAQANQTLAQIRGATEELRGAINPDSPLRNDLDQALQQITSAAQSISSLAEYLKEHPNALVTGRQHPPTKP